MANSCCKGLVVLATLAGLQASAAAASIATMSVHVTTIRIEPTRPGGMPGEPRETSPFWQSDHGSALSSKPMLKRKGRRH